MKTCVKEGCDNPLTGRQRKYCSTNCKVKQFRVDNPEYRSKSNQDRTQHRIDNQDQYNDYLRSYMAKRRLNGQGGGTQKYAKVLAEIQRYKCRYCGCGLESNLSNVHVDHIHPVARKDTYKGKDINEPINLTAACADCNMAKKASLPIGKWKPLRLDVFQSLRVGALNKQHYAKKEAA